MPTHFLRRIVNLFSETNVRANEFPKTGMQTFVGCTVVSVCTLACILDVDQMKGEITDFLKSPPRSDPSIIRKP